MACENWKGAIENKIIRKTHEEYLIQTGIQFDNKPTYIFINYCPFCGSKLNEKGCSKQINFFDNLNKIDKVLDTNN